MTAAFGDVYEFASSAPWVLALVACLAHAPLGRKWDDFFKEIVGTIAMITMQFPAGKWVGTTSQWSAWAWHGFGVVGADWICGGANVNPSVSLALVALGELEYPACLCRVAAQMTAALVTFPVCRWFAVQVELPPLGGPAFDHHVVPWTDAALHEFVAMITLCIAIFLFGKVLPVRKIYLLKMSLIAVVIRFNLETFRAAGCAMNPALGTAWAVFKASETGPYAFPAHVEHYLCYWVASVGGALVAAFGYAVVMGVPFFGVSLRPSIGAGNAAKKHD